MLGRDRRHKNLAVYLARPRTAPSRGFVVAQSAPRSTVLSTWIVHCLLYNFSVIIPTEDLLSITHRSKLVSAIA